MNVLMNDGSLMTYYSNYVISKDITSYDYIYESNS